MNQDNEYRCFRYIQVADSIAFDQIIEGWLELAEQRFPEVPKAVLEGDYLAYLPDGSRFKEVSFKREHGAVELALSEWANSKLRAVARIAGREFLVSDGQKFDIEDVQFEKLP